MGQWQEVKFGVYRMPVYGGWIVATFFNKTFMPNNYLKLIGEVGLDWRVTTVFVPDAKWSWTL